MSVRAMVVKIFVVIKISQLLGNVLDVLVRKILLNNVNVQKKFQIVNTI